MTQGIPSGLTSPVTTASNAVASVTGSIPNPGNLPGGISANLNLPIPPAASLAIQAQIALGAGFSAGTPVVSLCGFTLPSFSISVLLQLAIKIKFTFPPPFILAIGINCDLNNPLVITAGIPFGGGRVGTFDPDPDDL
jgi:hypothetical protein